MSEPELKWECDRVGYAYTTRGRTITEADLVIHSGQTGDFSSVHVDEEASRQTRFGQRIAHGTLVLSIAMGLKCGMDKDHGSRISYGYDRVRFVKPVFIGDTITVHVEVTASHMDEKRPYLRRIVESMRTVNQAGETVLSADHTLVRGL